MGPAVMVQILPGSVEQPITSETFAAETFADFAAVLPLSNGAPPKQWSIRLPKAEGQTIGAKMRRNTNYIDGEDVMDVRIINAGGMLADHNQRNPSDGVQLGDVILSVNGVRGNWTPMLAEFAKATVVLELERPAQPTVWSATTLSDVSVGATPRKWSITLRKAEGQTIGAKLRKIEDYRRGEEVMQVRIIHDSGPLTEHNNSKPGDAVAFGDMILSVNGVGRNWDAMVAEFEKTTIVLEVERLAEGVAPERHL